jgi:hypothetical protein
MGDGPYRPAGAGGAPVPVARRLQLLGSLGLDAGGLGVLTVGAWHLHPVAGMGVLGASLLLLGRAVHPDAGDEPPEPGVS